MACGARRQGLLPPRQRQPGLTCWPVGSPPNRLAGSRARGERELAFPRQRAPQEVLLYLAGGGAWKVLNHAHVLWDLVGCKLAAGEGAQLTCRERVPAASERRRGQPH